MPCYDTLHLGDHDILSTFLDGLWDSIVLFFMGVKVGGPVATPGISIPASGIST